MTLARRLSSRWISALSVRPPLLAALVLASAFITGCGDAEAPGEAAVKVEREIEQRLRKVEDEKQIRELIMDYGRTLDTLDFEAYSLLFAREGEWSGLLSEYTTIKGPEAIRAAMEEAFSSRTYVPDHITNVHLISNVRIDVEGDRATGYSKWTVLSRNQDGNPYVRVSGQYDDVYVREDGRWKFLSRVARREMP